MKTSKIIISIIGLVVVIGLGVLAIKSHHEVAEMENPVAESPRPAEVTPPSPVQPEAPVTANSPSGFNMDVVLALNDKVTFPDGLTVVLKEINDSRCKPGVQCIWAGEISGTFVVSGGILNSPQEIQLGTTNNKSTTVNGYVFFLQSATSISATITVQYKKPVATMPACYIGGCSGEICSDQTGMVSSCIYREQYACYKTATCERQASGQCGWTPTSALTACLSSSK